MAKKAKRNLERTKPEFTEVVRMAKGQLAANQVIEDVIAENSSQTAEQISVLMISLFKIGLPVYIETPNWVYVGVVNQIGIDWFSIEQAVRVISDGRHHVMMRTGTAESVEFEPSGGPDGIMVVPIDWLGPWCVWPHTMPTAASGT